MCMARNTGSFHVLQHVSLSFCHPNFKDLVLGMQSWRSEGASRKRGEAINCISLVGSPAIIERHTSPMRVIVARGG